MRGPRRSQTRAVVAFLAIVGAIGAAFAACTNYQRANGEGCLKDADCLSGYCVAQVCGELPSALNGNSYEEAGAPDTGTAPSSNDSGTPAATDSGGSSDSASDGPADGPSAANDSGHDAALADASDLGDAGDATSAIDSSTPEAGEAGDDASDAELDASDLDGADGDDSSAPVDAGSEDAQDALNLTARRSFIV